MHACAAARAAPAAHADPDDSDGPDNTDQVICGSFDAGVPPGDIAGRLGANDHRWPYWVAQHRVLSTLIEGGCG